MWCRLSAIAALKSLGIDNWNTQSRQYWESVSVVDILPYYFRRVNTAALLVEGPLQLHSTQLTTAQHKAIIPTPNPTTAPLAGGTRLHDGCQPGTLPPQRALLWHARRAIDMPSLSCLDVLLQDDFAFLDNMNSSTARTAMHHLRPPARKPSYSSSIEDESGSRASPAVLLWFYFLRTAAHTDDDKPPASEKLVHWGFLLIFFFAN